MIKKLVKYGNSQALVLDKALLEILNISDATKLKLSTDGTSLTITPLHEEQKEKPASSISTTEGEASSYDKATADRETISISESEAEMHYGTLQAEKQRDAMKDLAENPEKYQQIHKEFKETSDAFNKKYNYGQRMMELTSSQHYKDSMKKIATEAYKKNLSLEEYNKEIVNFMQKSIPEMKEFQEACQKFEKKYGEASQKTQSPKKTENNSEPKTELQKSTEEYKKNLLKMLEQPELFQQMAWEQKQMMDAFDQKYNYTQRITETMNNPLYTEALEKLNHEAKEGTISPLEFGRKNLDLIQSFMPEIPLYELTAANRQFESRYEELRNRVKQEALEETKN